MRKRYSEKRCELAQSVKELTLSVGFFIREGYTEMRIR